MRKDVLRLAADGAAPRSEDELLERYGVSRPTLRQAARILEHEQLIDVRRGVNGGFLAAHQRGSLARRLGVPAGEDDEVADLLRAVTTIAPSLAEMACDAPGGDREAFRSWVVAQRPRSTRCGAGSSSRTSPSMADDLPRSPHARRCCCSRTCSWSSPSPSRV